MTDVANTRELTEHEIDHREQRIFQRSVEAASRAAGADYLTDEAGTMWIFGGTAGQAKAFYAGEEGIGFTEVRCRKVYSTVDLDAIRDLAYDMARDPRCDADEIAYTWDGYGWKWATCNRDHPDGYEMWECTRA